MTVAIVVLNCEQFLETMLSRSQRLLRDREGTRQIEEALMLAKDQYIKDVYFYVPVWRTMSEDHLACYPDQYVRDNCGRARIDCSLQKRGPAFFIRY